MDTYDVAVAGAGFGGLAAALTLAEEGARVVLFETLGYPGGCASTFERQGHRFESGATLFSGFAEGQLMERWIRRHGLAVEHQVLDPVVELRTPRWRLAVPPDRRELVERFCRLPGAPAEAVRAFFAEQERVADTLWDLFSEPELLPPLSFGGLLRHASRLPRYLPLLHLAGRPLAAVVERHGLSDFQPLRLYLDATCQITVQAGLEEAEAPFALAAMDYYFRGTGHVHGGIGRLAEALAGAVEAQGAEVRFFEQVRGLRRRDGSWVVRSRSGEVRARAVVANLLPGALQDLLGGEESPARLGVLDRRVEEGWGAVMLYLALCPGAALPREAHHLELVQDPAEPLTEGNHLFCSVSAEDEKGRTPDDGRTVTVSTHLPLARHLARDRAGRKQEIEAVQERMRQGLEGLAPELWEAVENFWPASPRTFERFTGRPGGFVGGIPRRAGLDNYRGIWPKAVLPGLYLVGDSVFPGQSTLATALGGERLARLLLRRL